eukprot:5041179-Pleurochrysis_carterae.AAC.2
MARSGVLSLYTRGAVVGTLVGAVVGAALCAAVRAVVGAAVRAVVGTTGVALRSCVVVVTRRECAATAEPLERLVGASAGESLETELFAARARTSQGAAHAPEPEPEPAPTAAPTAAPPPAHAPASPPLRAHTAPRVACARPAAFSARPSSERRSGSSSRSYLPSTLLTYLQQRQIVISRDRRANPRRRRSLSSGGPRT